MAITPRNPQLQIAEISGGGQIPLDQVRSGAAGVTSLDGLSGDLLLTSGDGSIGVATPIPTVISIKVADAVIATITAAAAAAAASVQGVAAGAGIAVDNTDPQHPVVSTTGGAPVLSVVGSAAIMVDSTDPQHPIINNTGVIDVSSGAGITMGGSAQHPIVINDGVIVVDAADASVAITGTGVHPLVAATGNFPGPVHTPPGSSSSPPTYAWTGLGGEYGFGQDDAGGFITVWRAGVHVANIDNTGIYLLKNDGTFNINGDVGYNRDAATSAARIFAPGGVRCESGLGVGVTPVPPNISVGVPLVNSVAPTGTPGACPDFTDGTVYATDYPNLHATISQLTAKVAALEAADRARGFVDN